MKSVIKMTAKSLISEHKHLLGVLKSGDPYKLKKEHDKQTKELNKYLK